MILITVTIIATKTSTPKSFSTKGAMCAQVCTKKIVNNWVII